MHIIETYKYPILGGLFGLALALLLLTFGVLKTLLLLIFVVLGVVAGWYLQKTGLLDSFLNHK